MTKDERSQGFEAGADPFGDQGVPDDDGAHPAPLSPPSPPPMSLPPLPSRHLPHDPPQPGPFAPGQGAEGDATRAHDEAVHGAAARHSGIPGLPTARLQAGIGHRIWFVIAVVVPFLLGTAYLFLIAPDQYVTEYRFSVRLPVAQQAASSATSGAATALFGGNPTPGSDLIDNYTVTDYARSAQAARDLDARLGLRAMFARPSDPFSRLGRDASAEQLARYWNRMVFADYDPASGLAIVRVRAYTAQDSYRIASTLLQLSDDLVNTIGHQSQQDSLKFAEIEMRRAGEQVAGLRARLASLRQSRGVVDPAAGLVSGDDATANALRANLVQIEAQMAMVMQQLHNPDAPQMRVLRQQLAATRAQLGQVGARIGSGDQGLAATVGEFEDVNARLANAVTILQATSSNLSQAQSNADSQRLYLTTYVKPALAESAIAPNRWVATFILALGCAMVWILGMLLGNSIREHGQ